MILFMIYIIIIFNTPLLKIIKIIPLIQVLNLLLLTLLNFFLPLSLILTLFLILLDLMILTLNKNPQKPVFISCLCIAGFSSFWLSQLPYYLFFLFLIFTVFSAFFLPRAGRALRSVILKPAHAMQITPFNPYYI